MRIHLFFGDARHSLFIRLQSVPQGKGTDSYGEEGRRQHSAAVASPRSSAGGRRLQYSVGFFPIREAARSQLVEREKISVLKKLAAEVVDKINNLVGLNAVNLDEVFYVSS
ncbi:MAG: hypothetical protein V7K38_22600 [Nostoc sp.]|uniref:hypothetical protein n=1 Tax=Nostoc sp. TaxID=1180 RepID=UPI002FF80F65